jgi:hypothetical protein
LHPIKAVCCYLRYYSAILLICYDILFAVLTYEPYMYYRSYCFNFWIKLSLFFASLMFLEIFSSCYFNLFFNLSVTSLLSYSPEHRTFSYIYFL